jgi:broad specificity phosphatase PhoE
MSTITLIRHGQAHAFDRDSDRLTELGFHQARALGAFWEEPFDIVFRGSLRRHRETAEAAGYPNAIEDTGWNEYDARGILQYLAGQEATPTDNRAFQRMFEPLMEAWLAGAVSHPNVEPFAQFEDRVVRAFATAKASGAGRIAVFTSGGPIGLCVQQTLAAPSKAFLELNWRIRNTSLTEFTFARSNPGRCSLDVFNTVPHLHGDAESLTWR